MLSAKDVGITQREAVGPELMVVAWLEVAQAAYDITRVDPQFLAVSGMAEDPD
jgi:hypothetical protein